MEDPKEAKLIFSAYLIDTNDPNSVIICSNS